MKRLILIAVGIFILGSLYFYVERAIPYEQKLETKDVVLDSLSSMGPVVLIYDKQSHQNFWLKTYESLHASDVDSLRGKTVRIHFMKSFTGPLENRIFKIEIDSIVVFDQVVEYEN